MSIRHKSTTEVAGIVAVWVQNVRLWWDAHTRIHAIQLVTGSVIRPADYAVLVASTALLAAALVASRHTGHPVRNLGTFVHESGHAAAAVMLGVGVSGIRLAHDTSGSTSTAGQNGFRGSLVSYAGCPAGAVVAVGYAASVRYSHPTLALAATGLLALVLLVLLVRNWWGMWVLLVLLAAISAVVVYAPASWLYQVVMVVMFTLLLGSLLDVINYRQARLRNPTPQDLSFDTYGVARRLHCPAVLVEAAWCITWAVLAAVVFWLLH